MIKVDSFKDLVIYLGFQKEEGEVYSKNFSSCSLKVDFANKRMIYPEEQNLIVNDKTTSNFEKDENFVVFECVHRLLEKGYRPEHIELEPKWQLGRDAKGGKADIIVKNPDNSVLIIIECKTAGAKFNEEFKNTEAYGGQLFSYWQQEGSTDWLVLYASDWKDFKLSYKAPVIRCKDDENILKMAKNDSNILVYQKAQNDIEKHTVWKETYKLQWLDNVVFDEESVAYKIGIPPLRKSKLVEFKPEDKIVNRFEEILRHNNVSDKENAFNRLVALFICKLVDEITKQDNDEVDFQYKQGTDTYESLQDRLQRLHQQGMEEFMKEKIFYVEADYAEKLFSQYTGQKRKAAIADLNNTIRILKFYSNNDFAFKDVHNEDLFFQNGKILVEVVQLFQPYRIVYTSKHQFLGDLFEKLLSNGFKQNEGQFFTPIPITRFIWDSLPLKTYIKNNGLPRVIDYACGAGHFLTEAVEAINAATNQEDSSWVSNHIYGVEKDYRLARVSKISMFMNGAGGSCITFGDGLENYPAKEITNNSFDILVANPPYAVEGFKAHLKIRNNSFELISKISDDGKEIETLFIERAAQLIKPNGMAAIVMPDPILYKPYTSYIGAREILLKNFKFKAIVRLKGKTFSATGKETAILFLEKYAEPPVYYKLAEDFVSAVTNNLSLEDWTDKEIFESYIETIGVNVDLYKSLMEGIVDWQEIWEDSYLVEYCESFATVNIAAPKNATAEECEALRIQKFTEYFREVEKQKLFCFFMVHGQTTILIEAPKDISEQKKFLGYTWTDRQGFEGIVVNVPGGQMYDDKNRYNDDTLAGIIRQMYEKSEAEISEKNSKFAKIIKLEDAFDFIQSTFNVVIAPNANVKNDVKSQYPLIKLNNPNMFELCIGKRVLKSEISETGKYPIYSANVMEPFGRIDKLDLKSFDKDSVLWGIDGDWMTAFLEKGIEFYPTDHCGVIRVLTPEVNPYYLSMILDIIGRQYGFSRSYRASTERVAAVRIPLPPTEVQSDVVKAGKKVFKEFHTSRMSIDSYRDKILNIMYKFKILEEII